MRAQLARADLRERIACICISRWARRWRTRGDYAQSFEHYAAGNAHPPRQLRYDADETHARACGAARRCSPREFFAERARATAARRRDPIFIVGLPRSGSTLIEQILSSHSQVEGTMELPDIAAIARSSRARGASSAARYPRARSPHSSRDELRALGDDYLARHAHPAQDRRAVLHRQDAEQLPAHRPDPSDPAERQDHRCAPPSAGLLLLRLQAAFRARPELHLRPRRTSAATTATTSR